MNSVRTWVTLAALLGASAVGCSSPDPDPKVALYTSVGWNDDPGTLDAIGYQVQVDIGWPDRATDCFALSPDLNVTVNDRAPKAIVAEGCRWDVLTTFDGFLKDEPITIQLKDGARLLAEATYNRPFPGFDMQLVSPADGTVRSGEKVAVALPEPTFERPVIGAMFYWRDPPPEGVPPFHSIVHTPGARASQPIEVTAPTLTGRAWLVVTAWPYSKSMFGADASSGFESCVITNPELLSGPVAVEVVP